ncbi:Alanine racemase [hydrothermal vent metagenome]|uniref:Alanine racemase n=1 Tax=hydrothermal vent metagenome TaxID=652676 RepID=A0A3B0RUK1_9ZZZZ
MTSGDFPSDAQATLTIDLRAIIENYKCCSQLAGGIESAAMVKADAYGMGIEQVAPALFNKAGCRIFFIANLAEALKLRRVTPQAIIYVLNGIFPGHLDYFARHDIRPVLNDLEQVKLWADFHPEKPLPCAIHFDTGINRLGLSPTEMEQFINDAAVRQKLNIALIMSHLACSDDSKNPMNRKQLGDFKAITEQFPGIPASLANSGGILLGTDYHFDLVRPGLLLFGGNPQLGHMPEGIKPVFRITGKILQIRTVVPDDAVGYGATWRTDKPRHIATINIGYADGYLQMFNNRGRVYAGGKELAVVGRVSMDMIAVDVTDITISAGDDVELLGEHITLEMASEVSTLSQYEILTGVRERYQRIYSLND